LVMMAKRGKGNLKRTLSGEDSVSKNRGNPTNSMNQGKGQEITGVTLPAEGTMKGWEFGEKVTMACSNVGGRFYAVQGDCPRCAFDLWKGDLIADDPAWDELPRVACPTCATTFSMVTGRYGPPLKRRGLAGFVGGLAKTATDGDMPKDAISFVITQEEDGRVYCRQKPTPR
jgi:nitrite reductase/ring-hydroxylating ferredoxin subunit